LPSFRTVVSYRNELND